jgi:general secretion pathway protein G
MRGFTLIELVVTVLIVGMLAASAVPLVGLAVQRQKESELRSALRDIRKAIDAYHAAAATGRIAKGLTESGYPRRL